MGPRARDLGLDMAKQPQALSADQIESHLSRIERDGYSIVESAIAPDLIDEIDHTLQRLETELATKPGGNTFEGDHTVRIYNLLARDRVFERVPVYPTILPIVEGVLDRGCLVSSLSSISIDPGESAQPMHVDDTLIGLARPHQPVVCNSMWAITDFTEANGATRIVPGSHLAPERPRYGDHHMSVPAEMPKGSVMIWNGSLWHSGGANLTGSRRTGVAMNYCAGFIRQQENQQLGIPVELAREFEPRLQELAGFGTYRHLIGHIDKASPIDAVLGRDEGFSTVWDLIDMSTTNQSQPGQ